jgi:WD40 repeat protein
MDQYGDALPPGALARLGTVRWRPGAWIDFLTFAAEGKLVVARELYGIFYIYDVATGKEVYRLGNLQHDLGAGSWWLSTSVLSPDGRFLASIGRRDRIFYLWEVATGKELWKRRLDPKANFLGPVAFSADGRMLASWEEGSQTLFLQETTTGKQLGQLQAPAGLQTGAVTVPPDVTFAANGATVATTSSDGNVYLWKVPTGQLVRQFGHGTNSKAFQEAASWSVFSADGKTLSTLTVAREDDKRMRIATVWELETGKMVRHINAPEEWWNHAVLSPDGALLAWGGSDRVIRLQEMATGKIRHRLSEAKRDTAMHEPIFSPDSKTVFVRHGSGQNRVWDVQTGKVIWTRPHRWDSEPVAFSPDGRFLVLNHYSGGDYILRLLDASTGRDLTPVGGCEGAVRSLRLTDDGSVITTWASDQTVRQWDVATSKELRQFSFPGAVALSRDGQQAAVAEEHNRGANIQIWDLKVAKALRKFDVGQSRPVRLAYAPDGKTLAAENKDMQRPIRKVIRLYDVATSKERRLIPDPNDEELKQIVFSPDGTLLATAWRNLRQPNTVYLSEASSGKQLHRFQLTENVSVLSLVFSPDGRTLAMLYSIRAAPHTVVLWETASGRERCRLQGGPIKYDWAAVAFSRDGRTLAVACADQIIRLWSIRTGNIMGQFPGHHGGIQCLAFSVDGQKLVSGGADTTALVWDIAPLLRPESAQAVDLNTAQLESHWAALAGPDATKAFQAIQALSVAPEPTLKWFRERVKPVPGVDEKRLAQWIAELDDAKFVVRERARLELEKLGDLARPALQQALANQPSLEQARRMKGLLDRLGSNRELAPEVIRMVRAVEVLEQIGTLEARRLLLAWAEGAPEARLTRESQVALKRLAVP